MERESSSPAPFLDYLSGGQGIADMMMTSRSRQKEWLMDLHRHQDLTDRHHAVLSLLEETVKQVQDLRQENVNLKMVNAELTNRLTLLLDATSSDNAAWFGYSGMAQDPGVNLDRVLKGIGLMSLGSGANEGPAAWETSKAAERESPSPTSVMDSGRVEGSAGCSVERVSLPKSISVRSDGYLRTVKNTENRIHKQKVFVPGGEKEEQPLQLEVYHQGMFKTELCNKWQETGACPYGDHCQFAHGIEELRPVLRHPRYKTEVCRMVLNGDPCPYGHRCHFRHSLTDQEKIIRSINLRSHKA